MAGKPKWSTGQGIAFAGLIAICILSGGTALGMWLADTTGLPVALGWIIGAVAGFLLSREFMRWTMRLAMRDDVPERQET